MDTYLMVVLVIFASAVALSWLILLTWLALALWREFWGE